MSVKTHSFFSPGNRVSANESVANLCPFKVAYFKPCLCVSVQSHWSFTADSIIMVQLVACILTTVRAAAAVVDLHFCVVFCKEEVAQSIGVGLILWIRTGQFKTADATCPIDNQNAVTGSGTRRCGGVFGTPQWEQPDVKPCPLEEATAKNISGLTQTLLEIEVSTLILRCVLLTNITTEWPFEYTIFAATFVATVLHSRWFI